jgi:hypothetical protein
LLKHKPAYLKRSVRRSAPPPIVVQKRDIDICVFVLRFGAARQIQLQTQFFGSKTPAQRRLEMLYDVGYLERDVLLRAAGRNPTVYYLGRAGAELLRRELGVSVSWYRSSMRLKTDTLEHSLAIVEFWIRLSHACQQHGFGLEEITEREFRQPGGADRVAVRGRGQRLIPDLCFCITHNGQKSLFFLELDRGTMSTRRFRDKLIAYLKYRLADEFLQRFGHFLTPAQREWKSRDDRRGPSMRVLTVVDTEGVTAQAGQRRLHSLMQTVEHADVQQYKPARRFWFARLADLTAENILSEAVWHVRQSQGNQAVLLDDFER